MSQLFRVEGKHTAQTAHCALHMRREILVLAKIMINGNGFDQDIC